MDYIDTNIFLYFLTDNREFADSCQSYLDSIAGGHRKAATSVYTLTEVYMNLDRWFKWPPKKVREVLRDLLNNSNVDFLPLTGSIMFQVSELLKTGIKYGDAIHIATMRSHGLTEIMTMDKHFDNLPEITRVSPK
jgi:predicted nucleic acid-binding protein